MFFKIKEKDLKFLKSKAVEYIHSSGAKIFFVKNKDKELCFSITFKTPVYNSKGIPHIIEHSVLSSSKKYPLKDPYAEILKSSIVSFLNAFTFQDRTTYLFSTTNHEEYFKILDVYLDAVFNPLFVEKPEIFYNEGIRFVPKDGSLVPIGIVYNEMKGACGSRDEVYCRESVRSLFKGAYGNDSGGDPKEILLLKYEEVVDFYKNHYTPANAYIYVYGDVDETEFLKKIGEYLAGRKGEESRIDFSINPNDRIFYFPSEDRTNITGLNFPIIVKDIYDVYGLEVLDKFLMGMGSSPLREILENKDVGDNIESFLETKINLGLYSIIVKNLKRGLDLRKIILNKLEDISRDLDKKTIDAALNRVEFYMRDSLSDRSLPYGLRIMYEIEPHRIAGRNYYEILEVDSFFRKLREKQKYGYFESLIRKYLLNNKNSLVSVRDKPIKDDFEEKFLKDLKLTEKEVNELKMIDKKVRDFIDSRDTEKLKTIDLSKISKKAILPRFIKEDRIYFNKKFTRGITHIDLLYNLEITEEELPYLGLLLIGLKRARTKSLSKKDFSNFINSNLGSLDYNVFCYDRDGRTFVNFEISSSFLNTKEKVFIDILEEIKSNLVFEEREIRKGIKEFIENFKSYVYEDTHYLVNSRLNAYSLKEAAAAQKIKGLDFYLFLRNLSCKFDWEEIEKKLYDLYRRLFRNLSYAFITAESLPLLVRGLEFSTKELTIETSVINQRELIVIDSQVNFIGVGGRINEAFKGVDRVVSNILRYGYLWDELRLKRGVYTPIVFPNFKTFNVISYRDPNLEETFKVYSSIPEYLANLVLEEEEIKRAIIVGISYFDRPKEPHEETRFFKSLFVRGFTIEDYQSWRSKILNFNTCDLRKASKVLRRILDKNLFVVVGRKENQEKIKFDKVVLL